MVVYVPTLTKMDSNLFFTHLPKKTIKYLEEEQTKHYLLKWSMKGQIYFAAFSYNQHCPVYKRDDLIKSFFNDKTATSVLNSLITGWFLDVDKIGDISVEIVPCIVLSMNFFDRLLDSKNKIIRESGRIHQCFDNDVDGFLVQDELRNMLINEESDNYGLYNEKERSEFLFRIFRHLVLGGQWCQYENDVGIYLEFTKSLYKDLITVDRNPETKSIQIRSNVYKIEITDKNKRAMLPTDVNNKQNFVYVIIDPVYRHLSLFCHKFGGKFE